MELFLWIICSLGLCATIWGGWFHKKHPELSSEPGCTLFGLIHVKGQPRPFVIHEKTHLYLGHAWIRSFWYSYSLPIFYHYTQEFWYSLAISIVSNFLLSIIFETMADIAAFSFSGYREMREACIYLYQDCIAKGKTKGMVVGILLYPPWRWIWVLKALRRR